ncbi:DUF1667 domain-containing protein [Butyrivibrio sp. YAB3001]|uniref:DUF1667 domain-containing protein n=1 Tax=Butyrivibrio sp. YAB3001 TaxID=1520812 RepID=UPI0008F638BF|nr:DUF1667 domain-containing protein [Butyrivibrio sp. YAB3001]SFB71177.1 CxxC motif-containing protein [Butyrivibrio sp. YAB3001]
MEKRELTCIGCPMGCMLTVSMENGEVVEVAGNTCPKGDIYARKEVVNPTRIVTSTVKISGGDKERVSCKTASDIPKDKIFEVMKDIDGALVKAPVHIGDILIQDVAGTGVDVIATRNIEIA